MMQSNFIEVDGIRTHVLQAGEGSETVLLLHGGGVDGAELSWKLVIPVLAERFRVIAPDWPGYGLSGDAVHGMTLQELMEFCLELMKQMELPSVHLVGLSMGGGAALSLALNHPERVKSLALVDSYGLATRAPMHRLSYWMVRNPWTLRWTYAWMKKSETLVRWSLTSILKRPGSITPDLVKEVARAIQDERGWRSFEEFQRDEMSPTGLKTVLLDRLVELDVPVLILHGAEDDLVPLEAARQAAGM